MKAEQTVRRTINDHQLINRGDVLVLGLSGGPDSLCLFDILLGLRKEYGFILCALHFDHCVRGEDAENDAEFIKEYCKNAGILLKVVKEDIPLLAEQLDMSVEECGRKRRQEALAEYCRELKTAWDMHPELLPNDSPKECINNAQRGEIWPKTVLAHNSDDQAETVLLRIIRGTGVHGLAAMQYMREDGLIRPLLDTPRSAVEEYCRERGLAPRMDYTNESTDYLRNKVRLQILPELARINPNIKACLSRLAENAAEDDAYLDLKAEGWINEHKVPAEWKSSCPDNEDKSSMLLIKDLRGLSPALFSRVVKIKFAQIGLAEDISSVHIKALEKAIYANVGNKTIEFPANYKAYINHGELHFKKPGV